MSAAFLGYVGQKRFKEVGLRFFTSGLLLSVLALDGTATHAATKDLTKAIFAAIPWEVQAPDLDQRIRFAKAIEAYWVDFDGRVPRLSPKEREWIEGELAAQGERLTRALNSTEYALWSLNRHSDECLETIRNVISSQSADTIRQAEMFFWVKMVNCYDGTSDLTYYLERAGIPFNDDGGAHIQVALSNVTQNIIVNKAALTAMGEAMGWEVNR